MSKPSDPYPEETLCWRVFSGRLKYVLLDSNRVGC